jgi:hypothetical protein
VLHQETLGDSCNFPGDLLAGRNTKRRELKRVILPIGVERYLRRGCPTLPLADCIQLLNIAFMI